MLTLSLNRLCCCSSVLYLNIHSTLAPRPPLSAQPAMVSMEILTVPCPNAALTSMLSGCFLLVSHVLVSLSHRINGARAAAVRPPGTRLMM
jgi:hypothetical protein